MGYVFCTIFEKIFLHFSGNKLRVFCHTYRWYWDGRSKTFSVNEDRCDRKNQLTINELFDSLVMLKPEFEFHILHNSRWHHSHKYCLCLTVQTELWWPGCCKKFLCFLTNYQSIVFGAKLCLCYLQDIPLYAEVGGKPLSVVKSKETNEYVVSWLEETKKAPRGNFEIKVYDDEGYAALRKVILFL